MADQAPESKTAEALRIEIERARLALEQMTLANEQQRTFLQQWETDVRPAHELMMRAADFGHAYAKMTIQTLFFLNGGALIAFPSFAKLADVSFAENLGYALPSVFAFVIGLILTAATSLLAYLTSFAETVAGAQDRELAKYRLHLYRDPTEQGGKWQTAITTTQAEIKKHGGRARSLRLTAILVGIAALVAFVVGSGFAALVLVTAAS